jgi:LETM1-like protein
MSSRSFLLLLVVLLCKLEATQGSAVAHIPTPLSVSTQEKSNPVVQLASFVKDSLVRTKDGCGLLWSNHQRCNSIRSKQREHRDKLQKQWEIEGQMTPPEVKKRLKAVQGGITYEEFAFLTKGKEDRAKLTQIVFLMYGAPRFLPYLLMVSPNMLPSPFAPPLDTSGRETKWEKFTRERSHAVLNTLLSMEREAKKVPALAKLNIFGKKAQEQRMDSLHRTGSLVSRILSAPGAQGSTGAQLFFHSLSSHVYTTTEVTRAESRLVHVPACIIKGLTTAIEGPSPWSGFLPNFMTRGKVIAHLQKISAADQFLVDEGIDLGSVDSTLLSEACLERLLGSGPHRTHEDLVDSLGTWLELTVHQPAAKIQETGHHYNSNLAKLFLLCYNALDTTRDNRLDLFLPRVLFQGQCLQGAEGEKATKKH